MNKEEIELLNKILEELKKLNARQNGYPQLIPTYPININKEDNLPDCCKFCEGRHRPFCHCTLPYLKSIYPETTITSSIYTFNKPEDESK